MIVTHQYLEIGARGGRVEFNAIDTLYFEEKRQ